MRFGLSGIVVVLLISAGCSRPIEGRKTDEDRIADVHRIASLIEEFKAKNGKYPFAENWETVVEGSVAVPIIVNLSSHALPEEFQYPPPGASGSVITKEEFEGYLSNGLGREVDLPCDDRPIRIRGQNWPHIYQFLFNGEHYFVSCHLAKKLPFARELGRDFYKYEVGSIEIPERKTRLYRSIMKK